MIYQNVTFENSRGLCLVHYVEGGQLSFPRTGINLNDLDYNKNNGVVSKIIIYPCKIEYLRVVDQRNSILLDRLVSLD